MHDFMQIFIMAAVKVFKSVWVNRIIQHLHIVGYRTSSCLLMRHAGLENELNMNCLQI
jgi:hypothetical protein